MKKNLQGVRLTPSDYSSPSLAREEALITVPVGQWWSCMGFTETVG